MKLLPVAQRELRVASRRRGTYWVRFTAAAIAILTATLAFLALYREAPATQGQVLFATLSSLGFLYCLASGVFATSDCVSEEKRDGTLGLLFLTDLRGYDVVSGKMIANALRAVLALVAFIPVIAVPLLMGGVPANAVSNTALVLANTMFLSLAAGVFVSVLARDARNAIGGTLLVLLVLIALLPLVRWVLLDYVLPRPAPAAAGPAAFMPDMRLLWILHVNPVVPIYQAIGSTFGTPATSNSLLPSLAAQHGLAWAFLISACLVLPRVWQDRIRTRFLRTAPSQDSSAARESFPQPRAEVLDGHPFAWMLARDRSASFITWIGLAAISALWMWGLIEMKNEWFQGIIGVWTLFFASLWLKLRIVSVACRPLHEHRRSGALELLLVTPLQPAQVLRGQLNGLRMVFGPAAGAVLAAGILLAFASIRAGIGANESTEILTTFVVGLALLALDLWTLAWTATWQSLRSTRYVRAVGVTVTQILVLPWALFFASLILFAVAADMLDFARAIDMGTLGLLVWWTVISVAIDLWFLQRSQRLAHRHFHELATESYGPLRPASDRVVPQTPPGPNPAPSA